MEKTQNNPIIFSHWSNSINGALLINKPKDISSFGVIEKINNFLRSTGIPKKFLPKLGHGGTLDPMATGLLIVCVNNGVKLARYFLGSKKRYTGTIKFGETSISGDITDPIIKTSDHIPSSMHELVQATHGFVNSTYFQTPPMHSAKKHLGKPIYKLARKGIEIEREPKACKLSNFIIRSLNGPLANFDVTCSSGTFMRVLAQDFSEKLGTVGVLVALKRMEAGHQKLENAMSLEDILNAMECGKKWDELSCWVPFNKLLGNCSKIEVCKEDADAIIQGKQNVLFSLIENANITTCPHNTENHQQTILAMYYKTNLIAVVSKDNNIWKLDRTFPWALV